jgi:hypothetical protein
MLSRLLGAITLIAALITIGGALVALVAFLTVAPVA